MDVNGIVISGEERQLNNKTNNADGKWKAKFSLFKHVSWWVHSTPQLNADERDVQAPYLCIVRNNIRIAETETQAYTHMQTHWS